MSEMVERVALAIGKHVHILSGNCDLEQAARAAIEAMREPTDAMCIAGQNSPKDYDTGLDPYSVWTDMIDRALK